MVHYIGLFQSPPGSEAGRHWGDTPQDRLYTSEPCPCGDGFCHGCDDPQIERDLAQSRRDREDMP